MGHRCEDLVDTSTGKDEHKVIRAAFISFTTLDTMLYHGHILKDLRISIRELYFNLDPPTDLQVLTVCIRWILDLVSK